MSSTFTASQASWSTAPAATSTTGEPIQARSPLFFAVIWTLFTTVHAGFMLYAFRTQWALLPILLLFYSVFFAVGVAMAVGHVRWWRQRLRFGAPVLMLSPQLHPLQADTLLLSGFKPAAQAAAFHALWVHEIGTLGHKGAVHWTEQARSKAAPLQWIPNAGAVRDDALLQAHSTLVAPPMQRQAGHRSRWSLLVVPSLQRELDKPSNAQAQPLKVEAMKQGWRFALAPEAAAALHEPEAASPTLLTPAMTPQERGQAWRVLAAVATLFLVGGVGWAAYNIFGPSRFSPFTLMFAFTFGWMGWFMAEVAWCLHQGGRAPMPRGGVSAAAPQRTVATAAADLRAMKVLSRFKRMAKVLPAFFLLAFAWEAFGDLLLRQWWR
jgi:hypothetical protein